MGKLRPWLDRARDAYKKHPLVYDLFICLFFGFLSCSVYCVSTSFLYPAINADQVSVDSVFNQLYGQLWAEGRVPYVDFYDHKGLFPWGINALASFMGGRYALFFLEVLATSSIFYFLDLSLREAGMGAVSYLFAAASLFTFFHCVMGADNQEGDWVLPFVAASFYFFVRGIVRSERKSFLVGSFLAGLEFGLAFNARPLDGVMAGGFFLAYFAYYLRRERNLELLYVALLAILGMALPFAIFYSIAYSGGYLDAMVEATIVKNLLYATADARNDLRYLAVIIVAALVAVLLVLFLIERKKDGLPYSLSEFLFLAPASSLIVVALVIRWSFNDYMLSILPVYCFALLYGLSSLGAMRSVAYRRLLKYLPAGLVAVYLVSSLSLYYSGALEETSLEWGYSLSQELEHNFDLIPEEAKEEGEVYGLDVHPALYLDGGVRSEEKYFVFQSWWAESNPDVLPEVLDYLREEHPTYLLVATLERTKEAFGDIISELYLPYDMPGWIDNPSVDLYMYNDAA